MIGALTFPALAGGPEACPVTKASDAFSPPPPYGDAAPQGAFFFGTARLWTLVWPQSWQSRKLVWWTTAGEPKPGSSPALSVTFRRLDAAAPTLVTDHANWAYLPDRWFITTGLRNGPQAGCWEISGKLNGNQVQYVVWLGGQ